MNENITSSNFASESWAGDPERNPNSNVWQRPYFIPTNQGTGIILSTIEDQFAMAALTGILSGYGYKKNDMVYRPSPDEAAKRAYSYAKAMVVERQKQTVIEGDLILKTDG